MHSFASVKGGIGKSTLAIVCAKLIARMGRVPAVVDCDLTGTSIADGMLLRAPDAAERPDRSVDLDAPPTGRWLSFEETKRRRAQRRDAGWRDRIHPPPYFNDVLDTMDERWDAGQSEPVRVDAVIWRHEEDKDRLDDGWVRYLSSSAIHQDVSQSLHWYNDRKPFDWGRPSCRCCPHR